jgi:hypothetical protein
MKTIVWPRLALRVALIAVAAVSPVAFPASQAGYSTLNELAFSLILLAAALIVVAWALLKRYLLRDLAAALGSGAIAGALATLALEAVRYTGFRLGFMPGNLPELMGVLLFDRFARPDSRLHTRRVRLSLLEWRLFRNIFALGRFRLRAWWAIPYGIAIGLGFLISPVVQGLGVGSFSVNFRWHFAATVLAAHLAFGTVLAWLIRLRSSPWTSTPESGTKAL